MFEKLKEKIHLEAGNWHDFQEFFGIEKKVVHFLNFSIYLDIY